MAITTRAQRAAAVVKKTIADYGNSFGFPNSETNIKAIVDERISEIERTFGADIYDLMTGSTTGRLAMFYFAADDADALSTGLIISCVRTTVKWKIERLRDEAFSDTLLQRIALVSAAPMR